MLRIAIYARVSTSDRGQDTENQIRELRQFVSNTRRSFRSVSGTQVSR